MQGDYYSVPMTHASTIKLGVIVEGWQFLSLLNHCKMTKQVPKGNHPEERSKEATQRRKPTRGRGAKFLLYSPPARKKILSHSGTNKTSRHMRSRRSREQRLVNKYFAYKFLHHRIPRKHASFHQFLHSLLNETLSLS